MNRKFFALLLLTPWLVFAQDDNIEEIQLNEDEIIIEEVVDVEDNGYFLIDSTYNSSFTISVPMLSVVIPGTSKANGIVRFSVSHLAVWTLMVLSAGGLMYPLFLGSRGRLNDEPHSHKYAYRRSLHDEPSSFFEHLQETLDLEQVYDDIISVLPVSQSDHCLRRSVCEAHENASAFGAAGLAIRSTYSVSESNVFGGLVTEDLREAAEVGADPHRKCEQHYGDCLISPLEAYSEAMKNFYSYSDS